MKIAVVGLGAMGKLHCRVLNELGYSPSVCDIDLEAISLMWSKYGFSGFQNLETLLSEIKPDIVLVAVPTPTHDEVTSKCLQAGCHVLLEKPIAEDLATAKKLVDLAKEKELLLGVGYIETFNPAFQAVLDLHSVGKFGEITSVNVRRVGGIPRSADNVILDLMTHDVGLLLALFDREPDFIFAHKSTNLKGNIVDSAQTLLTFGQASACCETNWVSPVKIRRMAITGTAGYCEVDLIKQTLTWFGKDFREKPKIVDGSIEERYVLRFQEEPLKNEIDRFVQAAELFLMEKQIFPVTGRRALDILKVTLEIIDASGRQSLS